MMEFVSWDDDISQNMNMMTFPTEWNNTCSKPRTRNRPKVKTKGSIGASYFSGYGVALWSLECTPNDPEIIRDIHNQADTENCETLGVGV